jgi:hypothetical protein
MRNSECAVRKARASPEGPCFRLFPGVSGYFRLNKTPRGAFEFGMRSAEFDSSDRLGPDKFFLRTRNWMKKKVESGHRSANDPTIGYGRKVGLSGISRELKRDYVGISGTKINGFPLNPGYSRVFPHNSFVKNCTGRNAMSKVQSGGGPPYSKTLARGS